MQYKVTIKPRKKQLIIDAYLSNGKKYATFIDDNITLETAEYFDNYTDADVKNYLKTSVSYYVKK